MKKKTSGLLIRLIDVVLILLFGFISISQLERRSRIHLPISSETQLKTPDSENLVRISVTPLENGQWGFLVENETQLIREVRQLHQYLKDKQRFFTGEIRVKIYSEATSPIKYTMQVADLCNQMGLKKSLVLKLKNRRSGI